MNISIIGSGNMAHGIGTRLVASGQKITIYDRKAEKAADLAKKLGSHVKHEQLSETIAGDIIIFALPYSAILEVIKRFESQLTGKVVVDISNPVNFQTLELIPPPGTSGVDQSNEPVLSSPDLL
jgi:predicted dinucleotide-binding enzyme